MEESNLISDAISNTEAKKSWSTKEEMALKLGVLKYGVGNWKFIQEDPEFNKCLDSRSDVELQEKWQNMNIEASIPQPAIPDQLNVESNKIAECKQSPKRKMSEMQSEAVVDAEAEWKAEDKIEAEAEADVEEKSEAEALVDTEAEDKIEAEAATDAEADVEENSEAEAEAEAKTKAEEKKQNMKTEVSMPKPAIQDQESSKVVVVVEAGRFKIKTEEVIDDEKLSGLITDLEKNEPEHAGYCKDLEKLLECDEKADEILAYANEIMDRPLEDSESSN